LLGDLDHHSESDLVAVVEREDLIGRAIVGRAISERARQRRNFADSAAVFFPLDFNPHRVRSKSLAQQIMPATTSRPA